jgi:fructose-1-phosphate kinase PfkB-like protein
MSPSTDVTIELDSLNVGKTNIVKSKRLSFRGKALNVAVGVARLGCEAYTTGLMYKENGFVFENVLYKEGVKYSFVWNKGRVRENYKFILET